MRETPNSRSMWGGMSAPTPSVLRETPNYMCFARVFYRVPTPLQRARESAGPTPNCGPRGTSFAPKDPPCPRHSCSKLRSAGKCLHFPSCKPPTPAALHGSACKATGPAGLNMWKAVRLTRVCGGGPYEWSNSTVHILCIAYRLEPNYLELCMLT